MNLTRGEVPWYKIVVGTPGQMTNGQRLSSTELRRNDSDVVRVAMLRRGGRSPARRLAHQGLSALFYAITIARLGEHRSPPGRLVIAPLIVATLPVGRSTHRVITTHQARGFIDACEAPSAMLPDA
jgi:hypothetical protein